MRARPRSIAVWSLALALSLAAALTAKHLYSRVFPVVELEFTMDRGAALKAAADLSKNHSWVTRDFDRAVEFGRDTRGQSFIELTAGGNAGLRRVLAEGIYQPFTWRVREYRQGQEREAWLRFTPQGKFYGFTQEFPETDPGPALDPKTALATAEREAGADYGFELAPYHLIEQSKVARPSGRVDHVFTYERTGMAIGEGKYRLTLRVVGGHLAEIRPFLFVPETFERKFKELRSSNEMISSVSMFLTFGLFLLLGCGGGLIHLVRIHAVQWKPAFIAAGVVALLTSAASFNEIPASWLGYDTAIPMQGHLARQVLSAIMAAVGILLVVTPIFAAAEGLTRQAFKSHPLLWRIWSPQAASTGRVLQGTLVGYILLGFDLLFVVGFYSIALGRWGWWVPSESLFDPDLLSTPLPWLGPVSQALFAGSVEESVFRAIPLAWAGILGDRVGRRRTFIGIALVIQIFVFAAGHATYPGVPSYSRLVELILPSVIFAALYLRWGLFTSVICHFTYDLTLMSSPIFVAHTPGIWLHRVPVILAGIVPLLAIVRGRARAGKWLALPASLTNASWKAPATAGRSARPPKAADRLKGLTTPIVLFAAALMLTLVALFLKPLRSDIPPLNLNRAQAIQTARAALEASQIHLGPEWTPEATLAQRDADRIPLVRRNESEASVRSLMKDRFLTPPTWAVRFLRWNAEVVDRGEEYQVVMTADGARTRIRHILPERAPGKTLTQAEARKLALKAAMDRMGLPQAELQEVVTSSENRPARTDWRVEYKVPTANLKTAQARVRVGISGDQVTEVHPYVHVPEQWERAERARRMPMDLLSMACSGGLFVLFVLLVAPALLDRTRKGLDRVTFWTVVSGVFAVAMVHLYNRLPAVAAEFSTDAPFNHHLSRALLSNVLAGAALALIFALVMTRIWIRSELGARSAVRPAAWAVAACGLVMAAFNHLARAKSEAALDMLNGIESATSRFAALSAPRELVLFLLIGGVLALALRNLTQWTSTRDNPGAWNIAALVAWTVFSVGVSRFDTVTEALIAAVGICAGSAAAYVLGLRRDPTLVLFFLAPFRFVTLLEVWRMPAHPGSRVSTAVTGLMLLVLLWLAWQGMYKTSTAKAK